MILKMKPELQRDQAVLTGLEAKNIYKAGIIDVSKQPANSQPQ